MKTIEIKGLTKKFGDFTAVDSVSFTVNEGEIFGFLGANGSGKTTVIKMLCGLLHPTFGSGTVAGFDMFSQREAIRKNIGYMSQRFSLYEDLTIQENVELFGGIYGLNNRVIKERSHEINSKLNLGSFRGHLVKFLPLGIRQKVAFAVATIHTPKIVFLDEPTGGVDPLSRRTFWELIYEAASGGITIFVTTHYIDEAEYCNRISMMVDGKIRLTGSPSEIKQTFNVSSIEQIFYSLTR